jgi:hypothetical protein
MDPRELPLGDAFLEEARGMKLDGSTVVFQSFMVVALVQIVDGAML